MSNQDAGGGADEPMASVIPLTAAQRYRRSCPHAWRKGYYEGSAAAFKCLLCGAEAEEP
jgi:hypothetical protein